MNTKKLIYLHILLLVVCVLFSYVGCEHQTISILNVFDSYIVNTDLKRHSSGFGCVIRTQELNILFDTGYQIGGKILLSNMEKMNIDPKDIDIIVISHEHLDRGLEGFLKKNPNVKVYVPGSLPYIKRIVEKYGATYLEMNEFSKIADHIYSTGSMEGEYGGSILEQSLVIDTNKGLAVICGCAHPGIIKILERIKEMLPDKKFYLVMGGFHLQGSSTAELEGIIKEFKTLGVKKVAPSHCSGDNFRELSKQKFGKSYIEGGVGQIITF